MSSQIKEINYKAQQGYYDVLPSIDYLELTELYFRGYMFSSAPEHPLAFNEIQISGEKSIRLKQLKDDEKSKVLWLDDPNYEKLKLRKSFMITRNIALDVDDDDVKRIHSLIYKNPKNHPMGGTFPSINEEDLNRMIQLIDIPEGLLDDAETLNQKLFVLRKWRQEKSYQKDPTPPKIKPIELSITDVNKLYIKNSKGEKVTIDFDGVESKDIFLSWDNGDNYYRLPIIYPHGKYVVTVSTYNNSKSIDYTIPKLPLTVSQDKKTLNGVTKANVKVVINQEGQDEKIMQSDDDGKFSMELTAYTPIKITVKEGMNKTILDFTPMEES